MAPKKRPAAAAAAEPAPKKGRSTRNSNASAVDVEDEPAPPKKAKTKAAKASSSKSTAASKPTKGKKKATEITISSESESEASDSDVVIEEPKKKKKAAPKKKEAKTPAKKSKAALAAYSPQDEKATSTPSEWVPKKSPVKKQAKKVPFEQAFPAWFAEFAEDDDPSKMGGEGIEKLFEEMRISMEGVHPFILAWKVKSAPGTFGSFDKSSFETAFKPQKIDSSDKLATELNALEQTLYGPNSNDPELFRDFYLFLFPFLKNEGAKSLPPDMSVAVLDVALAPKYDLAKAFVEFAQDQGDKFKAMGSDAWTQLYDFCEQVQPNLEGWSEDDAWPSIIDAFVEWKKEKDSASV
ncbi:hypothetical protein JCM10213_005589 [Rhodosporidiobolus nylandii]